MFVTRFRGSSVLLSNKSSGFLASLLKSTEKQKEQNQQQSSSSTTSSIFSNNNNTSFKPKAKIDPKSIKLDLFPGLSKREQQSSGKIKKSSTSTSTSLSQENTSTTTTSTERIKFPRFNIDDNNNNNEKGSSSSSFTTGGAGGVFSLQPNQSEAAMSMISVSRRMGDWEEAMRIVAKHFDEDKKNNGGGAPSSSLSAESHTIGLLSQAAWACSRAVELSVAADSSGNTNDNENDDDALAGASPSSAVGTIEALNEIVVKVLERFYKYYYKSIHNDNQISSSTENQIDPDVNENNNKQQPNVTAAASFLRATTGNLVALSEALRSCGGVDLVMSLDAVIGNFLRMHWKTEGLLLETQRWNHEVIKVFDVCDDWEGALKFFIRASCRRTTATTKPASRKEEEAEEEEDDDHSDKQLVSSEVADHSTSSSSSSSSTMFQFKKKEDVVETEKEAQEQDEEEEDENAPSVFSASTLAMLIELLNRNGQHQIVSENLLGAASSSKGNSNNVLRPLIKKNEAAAIGRAYAVMINNYAFGTNQYSMRHGMRYLKQQRTSASSSLGSTTGSDSSIKMPKLNLDSKFYRTS